MATTPAASPPATPAPAGPAAPEFTPPAPLAPTGEANAGRDCPYCDGIGVPTPSLKRGSALALAAVRELDLGRPGAVARMIKPRPVPLGPCAHCWGSGLDVPGEALLEWLEVCRDAADWVKEHRGLEMDWEAALENAQDFVDHFGHVPATLRASAVQAVYNAFLAVRYDAIRRLRATDNSPDEDV